MKRWEKFPLSAHFQKSFQSYPTFCKKQLALNRKTLKILAEVFLTLS